MKYNPEVHNRRSIRLKGYRYANGGAYFVTICARNRECIFGEFHNDVGAGLAPARYSKHSLRLTRIGKIIGKNWRNIPYEYRNVDIDEYIIMPNHIHGIIFISSYGRAPARGAPTFGRIIGSFKSKCITEYLKYIRDNQINEIAKFWQRNYYERVIRNEAELNQIRKYIINNPLQWELDEENPDYVQK